MCGPVPCGLASLFPSGMLCKYLTLVSVCGFDGPCLGLFVVIKKKKKDPKRAPVLPFLPPFQMLLLREDRSFIYVMISNFQKFSVCFLRLLFPQRTFLLFSVSLRASEVCAHLCVVVSMCLCVCLC